MEVQAIREEVLATVRPLGTRTRRLSIGADVLHLAGLDGKAVSLLDRRFGGFIVPGGSGHASPGDYRLEVVRTARKQWLEQREPGELYRLEAAGPSDGRVVLSYHFALCRLPRDDGASSDAGDTGRWRVAVTDDPIEPLGRILDNVARFLTAQAAIDRGGFAMHGAGVLRDGKAHVFAGPSRSGKSTAVRLSEPGCSLGDDFAVVVPREGQWFVPALPFDNAERIDHEPPRELQPLATIWRLFQAERHRVERPAGVLAITSLLGCVAFPWAMPDCAELLLARVKQIADDGRFGHLHFRPDPGFWPLLG